MKTVKYRVIDLQNTGIVHYIRHKKTGRFFTLSHVLNSSWNREEFYHGTGRLAENIDDYTFYTEKMKPIAKGFIYELLNGGLK